MHLSENPQSKFPISSSEQGPSEIRTWSDLDLETRE